MEFIRMYRAAKTRNTGFAGKAVRISAEMPERTTLVWKLRKRGDICKVKNKQIKEKFDIRSARKKLGISQEELARQIFVSRQKLSDWENGICEPDDETRQRITAILQISRESDAGKTRTFEISTKMVSAYFIWTMLAAGSVFMREFSFFFGIVILAYSFIKKMPAVLKAIAAVLFCCALYRNVPFWYRWSQY